MTRSGLFHRILLLVLIVFTGIYSFSQAIRIPLDRLTAEMIELGSELCKVKLHPRESAPKAQELADRMIRLLPEYRALWNLRNYEKGIERSYNHFVSRAKELRALAEADPAALE